MTSTLGSSPKNALRSKEDVYANVKTTGIPVNVTEKEALGALIEKYNSSGSDDEKRDLLGKAKSLIFTAGAKQADEIHPEQAELLGDIEDKVRNGEELSPGEKAIGKLMFRNAANIDSLVHAKVNEYYDQMAEEIYDAFKNREDDPDTWRELNEKMMAGGAFNNPLVEMATEITGDIADGHDTYSDPAARKGLAAITTTKYKQTSNQELDEAMQANPDSWLEALENTRGEKIDSYNTICGLLGQDAVSDERLAAAVGEEVEDVRALTRNEYIQGMALPETLDDNYITGQILAQVEHIQAERSAPEWTQTFGAFAQRRLLLNFRKEKEEEAVEAKEKKEAAAKTSSGETALEDEFFAAQARVDELHAEGVHVEGGVQALADDMRRKRELKDLVRKGGVRGSKAA